jgi:hypothetical protein
MMPSALSAYKMVIVTTPGFRRAVCSALLHGSKRAPLNSEATYRCCCLAAAS